MKKVISSIVASVMAVSVTATVSASALNLKEENLLSVSTEIVASSMTIDGTEVPAGAVAITVNIDNNNGFDYSATKLELGQNAIVVVDEIGCPIVTKGDVLNDSITAAAVKDGTVVISSASEKTTNDNGEMFTFYISDNFTGVSVMNISNESIDSYDSEYVLNNTRYTYYIGDVHNDGSIDASDASTILGAIDTFRESHSSNTPFYVTDADANLATYFPHIRYADAADTDKMGQINRRDAENVLQFYSYVSTGYTCEEALAELSIDYGNYCGEFVVRIVQTS